MEIAGRWDRKRFLVVLVIVPSRIPCPVVSQVKREIGEGQVVVVP